MPLEPVDLRVLEHLKDWKSASDLSWELGLPIEEVEGSLRRLEGAGLVFRDGFLYIDRMGVR